MNETDSHNGRVFGISPCTSTGVNSIPGQFRAYANLSRRLQVYRVHGTTHISLRKVRIWFPNHSLSQYRGTTLMLSAYMRHWELYGRTFVGAMYTHLTFCPVPAVSRNNLTIASSNSTVFPLPVGATKINIGTLGNGCILQQHTADNLVHTASVVGSVEDIECLTHHILVGKHHLHGKSSVG